ncbi:YbfB/YjiJ family MFS transporter [Lutimaribacter marinistellae]|uniref:YbfB/YjiJ family MFS transporter n=1 Tax=Lutimaribacter marinistellae TaxID=1820329 RepID=A0ABV7TI22_9RHOB
MTSELSHGRQWLILAGLALGVCVTNGFARFAYGLVLPAMKAQLGWSYAQSGWLNTANALGYVAGALLTMALIRRVSPARLFSAGVLLTSVALLATGFDEAMWAQTLWRVAAGLFGALSFVTGGALAAALFPRDGRRNALAIALYFGGGGGLGIVFAGAGVPLMLEHWGAESWRWAWIGIGIVSLFICPLAVWSSEQLRVPRAKPPAPVPLPLRSMLGEIGGYAGFGLGYIVYLTFLSAWMVERDFGAGTIALTWVLLGSCITLSPFLWRGIFARFASGLPLAMILTGIATGSSLPVLWPTTAGLVASAIVFGACVFMAPGAVTSFTRQNLPSEAWGPAISFLTLVFAVSQTLGPVGAGWLGDLAGGIGTSLLAASGLLMAGAICALLQRPLTER